RPCVFDVERAGPRKHPPAITRAGRCGLLAPPVHQAQPVVATGDDQGAAVGADEAVLVPSPPPPPAIKPPEPPTSPVLSGSCVIASSIGRSSAPTLRSVT